MIEIMEEMKEVYLRDNKPVVMGVSFGKDSILMLTLVWKMLESLPPHQRIKTVHVITSDTGIEAPVMTDYIHRCLLKVKKYAEKGTAQSNGPLPIQTHLVRPATTSSFFYKTLGRGNLMPTGRVKSRWCTDHLKIKPMKDKMMQLITEAPCTLESHHRLSLWLAVRNEESARRKQSISKYAEGEDSKWAKHTDFERDVICYHPMKFITSDEVWFMLLEEGKLPFGVHMEEVISHYSEDVLECGIKTSSDQGSSCGGNQRQGCWTCGMSKLEDPMLLRYIGEGKADYVHLLEWKKLMLRMRNDIRYREVMPRRSLDKLLKEVKEDNQLGLFAFGEEEDSHYYESYDRASSDHYSPGGMTVEARRILTEYLMYIQQETGMLLLTQEDLAMITDCWRDTDGVDIWVEDLIPTKPSYDGEVIFLPNKRINRKETQNRAPVHYVTIDLKLGAAELHQFMKDRRQATGKSIFFFPSARDFSSEQLVWNNATFVVCSEHITSSMEAHEYVCKWLGWSYQQFTDQTKEMAIRHLILSALGEGIEQQHKRQLAQQNPVENIVVVEQDGGQFSLVI